MASGTGAYLDMLDAVKRYYGSGSDQWEEIAKYGIRPDNVDIVKQVPGVEIITNANGSYRSWNYNNTFSTSASNIAEEINSNAQSGIYGSANTFNAPIPVNTSVNASTGNYNMASGSKSVSTGANISTIARTVSTAVTAISAGCRLGKFFAQETYNQNPDYWDKQLPTMNPETWNSLLVAPKDDPTGLYNPMMQWLFGLDPETNETTAYMDEDALAYMAYAMKQLGMFGGESDEANPPDEFQLPSEWSPYGKYPAGTRFLINNYLDGAVFPYAEYVTMCIPRNGTATYIGIWKTNPDLGASSYTYDGKTVYYLKMGYNSDLYNTSYSVVPKPLVPNGVDASSFYDKIAWTIAFGESSGKSPEGVSNQPDYVAPDTSTWTDPKSTKQSLKQQHPEYWDRAIYNDVPQPDGTSKRYTYVPTPITPTTSKKEKQPTNTTVTKNQTKVNPNTSPDNVTNTITRYITDSSSPTPGDVPTTPETTVANPPDIGGGNTPAVIVPTGNASALWSVYNPSQAQLDSFGSWLWSSDFFSQLKKLFNDPMQAIIGVHKVFATPQVSGQSTIKCGYIDSEVPSNVVGSQYAIVNCGSVSLREYFGNVFDYAPYTEVKLFLPFIGVVPLDTAYVMRGSISVTYHVDVITGACLAEVSVRRDSAGGILYTFGGSCIVQYPVSSGSYMSVISGVLGTVASGVMAGVSIGTGNTIGAVYGISGAAQSILNTHTNVQHSGGFTGCTGAMGGKKPYLIISRPQTELNGHEPHMSGLPSNDYITLSSRSGFIRCKHVHVAGIDNATANEKDEIERLLKQGVMI